MMKSAVFATCLCVCVAVLALQANAMKPPRFRQTSGVKKTMCSDLPGMSGCAGSDAYACQSKKNPKEYECVTEKKDNPLYLIPLDQREQKPREKWIKCVQCVLDTDAMKPLTRAPTKKPEVQKPVQKLTSAPYSGTPYVCEPNDARCPLMGLEWELQQTYVHLVDGDKFVGCMDHSLLCKNPQYKTTCDNFKETRSIIEMVTTAYQFGPQGIKDLGEFKKLIENTDKLLKIDAPYEDVLSFNEKCLNAHPFLIPINGWSAKVKKSKWDKSPTLPPRDIVLNCNSENEATPLVTAGTLCKMFNSEQAGTDVFDLGQKKQMTAVIDGNHESLFTGWSSPRGQWTGPVAFEDWIADMIAANPKGVELCNSILGGGDTWAHKFCVFKAADAVINGKCLDILDTRETYCKDWWGLMPRISPRQMAVLIRDEYKGLTPSDLEKLHNFDCNNRLEPFIKDTFLYAKAGKPAISEICKLWKEDHSIPLVKHDKAGYFQPFKLDGKVYLLIEGRQGYLMDVVVNNFVSCTGDRVECFKEWYSKLRSFSTSDSNGNTGFVKKMMKV